jgi:hypothetical protein
LNAKKKKHLKVLIPFLSMILILPKNITLGQNYLQQITTLAYFARGPGKLTAPLSTFRNVLSAFRPNVTLVWYQQAGRWQKAESTLTLAKSGAIILP